MSYCRFSTDDYGSDVYVYADGIGFVTHVARSRLRFQETLPPPETDEIAAINRSVRVDQLVQDAVYEPIALPSPARRSPMPTPPVVSPASTSCAVTATGCPTLPSGDLNSRSPSSGARSRRRHQQPFPSLNASASRSSTPCFLSSIGPIQ